MKWLKKLLLPFEEPDHPLYSAKPEEPSEDWDELGPYPTEYISPKAVGSFFPVQR